MERHQHKLALPAWGQARLSSYQAIKDCVTVRRCQNLLETKASIVARPEAKVNKAREDC
jgi:hypothetical protein